MAGEAQAGLIGIIRARVRSCRRHAQTPCTLSYRQQRRQGADPASWPVLRLDAHGDREAGRMTRASIGWESRFDVQMTVPVAMS